VFLNQKLADPSQGRLAEARDTLCSLLPFEASELKSLEAKMEPFMKPEWANWS
jgi:hypothetical protein